MTCASCLESIDAFVDDELLPDEMERVREHLRTCAACATEHARAADLSQRLRTTLMRYSAPDVLKARIRASAAAADEAADDPWPGQGRGRRFGGWWPIAAAAIIAAAGSGALTAIAMQRGVPANIVDQEVVASHIRSLMPGHLTDVASTDEHNVKPWFNGRVNLSPPVPRLDSAGYPLIGGRLDYIDGHPAATIVYGRRLHIINVFSWPVSAGDAAPTLTGPTNGYHIVKEQRDGLALWFVSDVNTADLEDFVRRFNAADTPRER